jgi:23S rRNA pseudouridine2605 synthase
VRLNAYLARAGVEKTYVVEVEGEPTNATLEQLQAGVELDDGATAPAKARRLTKNVLELTIHEGRNRQVKRMLEAVGHPVTRLHRSEYAGLDVEGLEPGEWRELTRAEVERLRHGS